MLLYQEDIIDCLDQAICAELGYDPKFDRIYDLMHNVNLGTELYLTMKDYDMVFNPTEEF